MGSRSPFWTVVLGFFVGLVDVIPGVSGGTVILLAEQYVRFTSAMSAVPSHVRRAFRRRSLGEMRNKDIGFLSSLGVGALVGAGVNSVLIGIALSSARAATAAVFVGVIGVGAVLVMVRAGWSVEAGVSLALGVGVGFGLSFVSVGLPTTVVTVFVSSILASSATVLPGVSGAFVLYALGQYEYAIVEGITGLASVFQGQFESLGIVGGLVAGGVVGALGMSRVARRFVEEYEDISLGFFSGLMLGTVRVAVVDAVSGSLPIVVVVGLAAVGGGGLAVLWWVSR